MPFFTRPIPVATVATVAILLLGILLPAVPTWAEGFSAPGLRSDEDDSRRDLSGLLSDRRDRHERDAWRRPSAPRSAASADPVRGVAARELLDAIEDGVNAGRWIPFRHRRGRGQEILATLEQALPEEAAAPATERTPAEPSLRSRFRFHLARGLEYRQELEVADQPMKLRLYGPLVSGSPGLGLRLRGDVSQHAFELEAFGSADEVGLEIHFGF